jgi:hypothetical protein
MINDNKHLYKKYEIYLVVKNKNKVLNKVISRSRGDMALWAVNANITSKYITKYMTDDHILDKDDLNKYFLLFKQDIIKNISRSRGDMALWAVNNNWCARITFLKI